MQKKHYLFVLFLIIYLCNGFTTLKSQITYGFPRFIGATDSKLFFDTLSVYKLDLSPKDIEIHFKNINHFKSPASYSSSSYPYLDSIYDYETLANNYAILPYLYVLFDKETKQMSFYAGHQTVPGTNYHVMSVKLFFNNQGLENYFFNYNVKNSIGFSFNYEWLPSKNMSKTLQHIMSLDGYEKGMLYNVRLFRWGAPPAQFYPDMSIIAYKNKNTGIVHFFDSAGEEYLSFEELIDTKFGSMENYIDILDNRNYYEGKHKILLNY